MKTSRIHRFGPPDVVGTEELRRPAPGAAEVLLHVEAAGVGPWDAWVRAGRSALPHALPLTLGADFSGTVQEVGAGVRGFAPGEAARRGVRARFFLVDVTTERLERVAERIEGGSLRTCVGAVLALEEARSAHEMLEGLRRRPRGRIVLRVGA